MYIPVAWRCLRRRHRRGLLSFLSDKSHLLESLADRRSTDPLALRIQQTHQFDHRRSWLVQNLATQQSVVILVKQRLTSSPFHFFLLILFRHRDLHMDGPIVACLMEKSIIRLHPLTGLLIIVGGGVGVRIWCELLIVMFKIHENLKKIADRQA